MISIDVVIVNWNSGVQLNSCLYSVDQFGGDLVSEVVVVDNASTDGSGIKFDNAAVINLVALGSNLGFGKACNLGAEQAQSEYLLFLNPDAALYEDTLTKALAFMRDPVNEEVGICGVQLLDESGSVARSCARFPSPLGFSLQAFGIDKIFPGGGHVMAEWDHGQSRVVDQVIGAFFLVRRELFEALNGFDERFFVYFEEVDFSYRARQAGWKSVYLADAQAFHSGGGTSKQIKARRLFYSLRSRLLYAFKHFSWAGAWVVLLTTLLIEPVSRSVLAIARLSWSSWKETWSAYAMLWRWLPQWWFKGVTR
jgi:GT2 family glycosyltransferase